MSAAAGDVAAMRFGRWADANRGAARNVEVIISTFRVSRRVAYRWRRAHLESLKQALPAVVAPVPGRHEGLPDLDPDTSAYVGASLRAARERRNA
jgi:hypothetical protein